jgi:hypothetical protein
LRLRAGVAAVAIGAAIALAACGSSGPTSAPPSTGASPSAPSSASAVATTPLPSTLTGPPLAASVAPTGVEADRSLLDLVPAAEAGATVTFDAETTASVAGDPGLARDVDFLAIGLARPNGATLEDPNFAVVNLVRLRDSGASDDAWFRDWRDSYDKAACEQAGGVARNAETEVDTLVVFTAACAGGAFTYHVRIADGVVVLSMTSIGPKDLGRRIVEKLHR